MSDLHRAIQERGDDFRPDRTPPFKVLRDRKRRRDQRRTGAAVALSVAAVLGIAVVPSALSSGGGSTPDLADQAPGGEEYRYSINWTGNTDAYSDSVFEALTKRCFALPGLSGQGVDESLPPLLSGRIEGKDNADAFRDCAREAAPGANVDVLEGLSEQPPQTSYTLRPSVGRPLDPAVAEEIDRCLALPGVTGSAVQESNPPTYGITADEDAKSALEDCARDVPLFSLELAGRASEGDLTLAEMQALQARIGQDADSLAAQGVDLAAYGPNAARRQVNVGVASDLTTSDRVLRARYGDDIYVFAMNKAQDGRISTTVVTPRPTSATICDSAMTGQDACRVLSTEQAVRLASIFNEAVPLRADEVQCRSLAEAYLVTFVQPNIKPVPIEVSKGCGPLIVASKPYRLDPALRDAVARAFTSKAFSAPTGSGYSLTNLAASCGNAGNKAVTGTVTGPPGLIDFDGLVLELRTEQGRDGSTRPTAGDFTISNADPRGPTAQVVLRRDDGQVLTSGQVDLQLPAGVTCR